MGSLKSALSTFPFQRFAFLFRALALFLCAAPALSAAQGQCTLPTGVQAPPAPNPGPGRYYALIIGIDAYHGSVPRLNTAVNDACALGKLLQGKYGFTVNYLTDQYATRFNILDALNTYANQLVESDSLLIYYAGHGVAEDAAGYWLPVDSESSSSPNRISSSDLMMKLHEMVSRHVLVITDSCYGADMVNSGPTRGLEPVDPVGKPGLLERLMETKSRTLISSGGDEPVADSGSGGHSVFATNLLHWLESEPQPKFADYTLFADGLANQLADNARQAPFYAHFPKVESGDNSGDFVFVRSGYASGSVDEPPSPPQPAESVTNPGPSSPPPGSRAAASPLSILPKSDAAPNSTIGLDGDYDFGNVLFAIHTNADGSLSAITAGSPPIELDRTSSPLQFTVKVAPGLLDEFHRASNGSIDELLVHQPTGLGIGVRVSPATPDSATINSYTGQYQVGGLVINISELANGVLTYAVVGQTSVDMRLAHGSWFVLAGINSVSVEFASGPNGKPSGFTLHLPTGDTFLSKVK